MTERPQIQMLEHGNRSLIALLSLAGLLLDGGQTADLVLQIAVLLWLCTPELRRMEPALLRRYRHAATRRSGVTSQRFQGS